MARASLDSAQDAILVYDGECPFCSHYARLVRVQERLSLQLVDARSGSEIVKRVTKRGLDLNEGFVLMLGDRFYHGDECLHVLALLSTRVGLFNRANFWLFSRRTVARRLYPVLKSARNITLKALGKQPIKRPAD